MCIKKDCQCSYEVAFELRKKRFGSFKHLGRRLRAEYIAQQELAQKAMEANGYDDDMPPCVNCHPEVFTYCHTTGHECKIFNIYTSTGKVGEHTCFHKLAKSKAAHPKMARYCSEDSQKITIPKRRECPNKRRAGNAKRVDV